MATDSYTYGLADGVHRKIGWVIPGRFAFAAGTEPSETDVDDALDQIASEIHVKLQENGYPVQTLADLTTNAPRAYRWLQGLNEAGACMQLLQGFAIANNPEDAGSPENYWRIRYLAGLKMIPGMALDRMGLTKEGNQSDNLVSGSTLDTDGNVKLPLFTRSKFEVPGTSILTEGDT